MSINSASNLDIEKFRKVHALMNGGATEGERQAAKTRAAAMAKTAGLTFEQAVSKLAAQEKPFQPKNIVDDLFNSPEMRAERAERERKNEIKRRAALNEYGSEEAI